jgi:hypothetical protein
MLPWCRCYLDENYDYPKMMAREENSRECKTALVMLPWCGCYLEEAQKTKEACVSNEKFARLN